MRFNSISRRFSYWNIHRHDVWEGDRMSMLIHYIRRVKEGRGLERQANLSNLRNYIKTTNDDWLIDAIDNIGRIDFLNILWEAGLRPDLQRAVLRKHTELTQRRGE